MSDEPRCPRCDAAHPDLCICVIGDDERETRTAPMPQSRIGVHGGSE
jgi:hypothetical protein